MGKKSGPPAPDYAGAAKQQAEASQELALQDTYANRPTINTPWGSQTWSQSSSIDPATGKPVTSWTQNINLSPQEQAALDSQQAIQQGRSQAAETLLGQATSAFQQPMNWNNLPQRPDQINAPNLTGGALPSGQVANKAFGFGGQITSDLGSRPDVMMNPGQRGQITGNIGPTGDIQTSLNADAGDWRQRGQDAVWNLQKPMFEEKRAGLENQLANMGLARDSDAWKSEMRRMDDAEARAQLQAIETGRGEAQQMFGQDIAAGQFANQAQGQQYQQALGSAQFENQAQGQDFAQLMQQAGFFNQAQGQDFNQDLAAGQFSNQAQGQGYQQAMGSASFENQAGQQEFQNLMALAQTGDQRAIQQLNAQIAAGGFNLGNRSGAISEEQARRGMTLNELNALLTGQQVAMPNMPNTPRATMGDAPNLLGAANSQYQSNLDQYNARMAFGNQLANLGGQAAGYFMFSDERLKEDVHEMGLLSSGVRVVHYRYRGLPDRRFIGVIAQEVLRILPEAVARHPSGYLMVDYARI